MSGKDNLPSSLNLELADLLGSMGLPYHSVGAV